MATVEQARAKVESALRGAIQRYTELRESLPATLKSGDRRQEETYLSARNRMDAAVREGEARLTELEAVRKDAAKTRG